MGLITGLLTLPLAPVRGVAWAAEQLRQQALEEGFSEGAIRRQLAAAQREYEAGTMAEDEYEAVEDELIRRLMALRRADHAPGV